MPDFKTRHRAAAVVSKMMLLVTDEMLVGLGGKMNLVGEFPEIWVLMVIRRNDDRGNKPIMQKDIATALRTSHQNVGRWLKRLKARGAVEKRRGGWVGADGFLADRINAKYFDRIMRLICTAARELEQLYPKLKSKS